MGKIYFYRTRDLTTSYYNYVNIKIMRFTSIIIIHINGYISLSNLNYNVYNSM